MKIQVNPLLDKDFRVRLRSWRFPALLTVSIFILASIIIITIGNYYSFNPREAYNLFLIIAVAQLYAIVFVVPTLTANALTSEKERQTIDLLLCTRISSLQIILGKLFSSVLYVMLLLVAALPVLGFVFIYSDLSFFLLIKLYAFYFLVAVCMGSVGLFWSSVFKKTIIAIIFTYMTIFFMVVIYPILIYYLSYLLQHPDFYSYSPFSLYRTYSSNPSVDFSALVRLLAGADVVSGIDAAINFKLGTISSAMYYSVYGSSNYYIFPFSSNPLTDFINSIKPSHIGITWAFILTFLLVWASTVKINPLKTSKYK